MSGMVKVVFPEDMDLSNLPDNKWVSAERFLEAVTNVKHVPVFESGKLNLADLNSAGNSLMEAEGILLNLNHILEDCPLNAVEITKIGLQIKKWRNIRRYYKCLNKIADNFPSDPKKLQQMVAKQANFINVNKQKAEINMKVLRGNI